MYNTYTIGELAKILGITAETIRYYERKGIIAPIHDQETGYRYYTTWDLHMLIRARCYLGFGLSIEETAGILQSKSLEEIDDLLEKQEQIIEKNIIYQMNLLKKIQVHKKQYGTSGTVVRIFHFAFRQIGFVWETFYYMEKVLTSGILEVKNNTGYIIRKLTFDDFLKGDASYFTKIKLADILWCVRVPVP